MNVTGCAKSFGISKRQVWDAYKRVKANRGAAGVDGQSIAEFEENLKSNLYKLWNRLASGSYFPPPVRRVEIPKGDGKTRPLGIPTVADRIAQMVVTRLLEPILEPQFHADSYGYRPKKSAKDALAWISTRRNSPNTERFFGEPHTLMVKVRWFHQGTFTGESSIPEALMIGRWARRWKCTCTSCSETVTSAGVSTRSRKMCRAWASA